MRKWGRWVAEVRQPNSRNRIWLGSYHTPEEAARAYDAAVFCLRGPSALLNFPANPPDIPSVPADLSPSDIQEFASRHAHKFPPASTEEVGTTAAAVVVESDLFGGDSDVIESSNGGFGYWAMGEEDRLMHDHESLSCGAATQYQSPRFWTF